MQTKGIKMVSKNPKAYHDYFIEEKYEAGIALAGTEVKSIRLGNVNLKDSYCIAKDGQMTVHGMHISPYEQGNIFNKDPRRPRKLLMHKREILRLYQKVKQDGYALVPLSGPSWRSVWPRARSSTTSGSRPPSGTPNGRWTAP